MVDKMADFCDKLRVQKSVAKVLGNRCSVLLSYRGNRSFPRFLRLYGQCGTRRTRTSHRFALTQRLAQFVHGTLGER